MERLPPCPGDAETSLPGNPFPFPRWGFPLVIALCAQFALPAEGGLRSRALPPLAPGRVEPALSARAARTSAERIHAVVEVPWGERAAAEAAGIRLLRSIDSDLWLASLPVSGLPEGRAAMRAWDLGAIDRTAAGLLEISENAPGTLTVRLKVFTDVSFAPVRGDIERAGGRVISEAPRVGVLDVEIPAALVRTLAARDDLRWIEPISTTYDPANNDMRLAAGVDGPQAQGIAGNGVVIGQWDTGLADGTHPDLAGRIAMGEAGLPVGAHATHVAGTAIGDGTASQSQGGGVLQWRGVAFSASIVGWGVEDHIAEVDTAIAVWDIDLSTNSWVYPVDQQNCALYGNYGSSAPEYDQIVTGIYGKAIPVVFAAGNERDDLDCDIAANGGYGCIPPPGTAKNVVTVGAHQSDAGHMTPFSSWGPTDDGRMKPDVAAPGCQASGDLGITSTQVNGVYSTMCGTSMAAPVVSGAIAMILEEWGARFSGSPRPATSKALLGGFADDRAVAGPDYRFGLGAVQVSETITALQTMTTIEDEVAHGVTDTWDFLVPAGTGELKVTLTWDDPVAAELADTTLVNDLDLELIAPSAGTYLPFVLDPANPSAAAVPGVNRLDNVEQVAVASPEAGLWTARVIGTSVPEGPQGYSVVGWDARAPADPAGLTAIAVDDTTAELTWIRPGDPDRAGTLLVRSAAPIAWTPTDGTSYTVGAQPQAGVLVVANDDVDYSSVPRIEDALEPGTTYWWAGFSYDEVPNYSAGVVDTATTSTDAVDAPAPVRSVAAIRFARTGANPFRDRTTFRFDLPSPARIELVVFDAAGRRVAGIARGELLAGSHVAAWDGRDASGRAVAAGVYFVRFRAGATAFTEKVHLLR